MSIEKTDALVIRQADFSETSRVVTFFTRDFGRIATLAKGAKRLKGPFEAAIDLLSACRIVFIRKSSGGLDLLTEAGLIQKFQPNGRDLVSLYGGYYVAELLSGLTEEYDPHPTLFDQSLSCLEALASQQYPKLTIVRFELTVLREIGQLPAFDFCIICESPTTKTGRHAFWVNQGGVICPDCRRKEYEARSISAGTLALLKRITSVDSQLGQRVHASDSQLKELQAVTGSAISHALGRRPKMLRYITSKKTMP
jgi:DNA repair protein RecO (recombination protein O)